MGKSLDSPENGNVDKMSENVENVRKMSKNCPEGPKTQFWTFCWTIFAYLVDAFVWWPCPMHACYKSMYCACSMIIPTAALWSSNCVLSHIQPLPASSTCFRKTNPHLDLMSGPWMAEMADIVDAADGAAAQTAQAGDQAPPVSKASPPTVQEIQAVPISVDDTPTEPATSPRRVDPPVQEWPVEVHLPTREYGPLPEPGIYPTPFVMNDGQWTQQEHEAHLRKAAHATLVHVWNREAREEAEMERSCRRCRLQGTSIRTSWSTSKRRCVHASSSRCPRCSTSAWSI